MDPVPTDAVYDLTLVEAPTTSPAGDRVAFVAVESEPDADRRRRSVFVVPTDGSRKPHRLTRVTEAETPRWSPDGRHLAVTMAREEDLERRVGRDRVAPEGESADDEADTENGESDASDDEPVTQVWTFDLERGGDPRQVTDFEEGVESFDWGPHGDRLVVAARDPTDDQSEYLDAVDDGGPVEVDRLQHKRDGVGFLDEVTTYLFVVDVDTGESDRLDVTGLGYDGASAPAWGPDRIAFCGLDPERVAGDPDDTSVVDLYTVDPDGGDRHRVTDGEVTVGSPAWSPDGERLAFTVRHPENWYRPTEAFVADVGTDGGYESVSAALDRTLARGAAPEWLDGDTLLALVGDEARTRFARLSVDGAPERVFEAQGEYETFRAFSTPAGDGEDGVGDDRVTVVRSHPAEGIDVFALSADAFDPTDAAGEDEDEDEDEDDPRTRLSAVNTDFLEEYGGLSCRRVHFESAGTPEDDPAEIEAVAYSPEGADPEDPAPRPFVLAVHGGPMAYDEPGFDFDDLVLTSRGYVVWRVNYRGSTSYGREFCEILKGRWNSVEVTDLLAGVDAAVGRGVADPDRLFVTGFSQGGVNTAYCLTETDRFAAAAPEHGIYDARSCFGTDDSHNWWEADYGLPWENPSGYDSASSIGDVDEITTPTLVTAGEEDWRCPPTQAEQLYVSLKKRGVESRLVVYQGENHDIGDPDRASHRLDELVSWFRRHDPVVEE